MFGVFILYAWHTEVAQFSDKISVSSGGRGPHVRRINKRRDVGPAASSAFQALLFSLHGNNFFVSDKLSDIMFDT